MNLKQLIKFGLENSQEPVIKNPVLRQALEPRSMDLAALSDDVVPGSLKDELAGNFDPSQETYEEYLRRINLERPFNMNQGGRIGFQRGSVASEIGSDRTIGGLTKKERIAQGLEKGRVSINIDPYTKIVNDHNKAIQEALDAKDASKLPKSFAQTLREPGTTSSDKAARSMDRGSRACLKTGFLITGS